MNARVLRLNAKDNVLVALSDLRQGEEIPFGGHTYRLKTDVPAKHKFATAEIEKNGAVVMFGVLIGSLYSNIYASTRPSASLQLHGHGLHLAARCLTPTCMT